MRGAEQLEIVYRDPALLQAYEKNPRHHPDEQLRTLRRLMDTFGNYAPILLRDDEQTIGAGHGRQLAALLAPALAKVPTITLRGLSDDQWRALVIADNKIGEASSWDDGLLKGGLAYLRDVGFDLSLTAFTALDLDNLFAKPRRRGDPDEAPPPPAVPVSVAGDVWQLGSHRVICGDSTSREVLAKLFGDQKPEVCLTDPPYGIGFGYDGYDDSSNAANARLVQAVFDLAPKAKVWTPGLMNLGRDVTRFGPAKVLCWHKGFAAAGNGLGGASTWEPVLVIAPKHKKLSNDHLDFKTDREQLAGKSLREHHPCPKPAALFAHLAEAFCSPKGIIYEPFSGSGTTIIAAEMTGRTCFGIDLSPAYVDVATMRWEAFTGLQATLAETGETYQQVKDRRLDPI